MVRSIVGVKYKNKRTGEFDSATYSYFCELPVSVGEIVSAPTSKGDSIACVVQTDVPEGTIDPKILEVMKTITAYAIMSDPMQITIAEPAGAEEADEPPILAAQELIVVKQLPIIEERLKSISEQIKARTEEALTLEVSEDTVKTVKRVRTELANGFKALEAQRIAVKKAVLAPYEQFEAIYKSCVTNIFMPADTQLKARIDQVENALKDKERQKAVAYFNEYAKAKGITFLTFDRADIVVNLTTSGKSVRTAIDKFIDRVAEELAMIDTQPNKEEVLVEYMASLNVASAVTTVTRRHEAIATERKRAEEARALAEQREAAARRVEVAVEETTVLTPPVIELTVDETPFVAPIIEQSEKYYSATFTVRGTLDELRALKKFLEEGGYTYESV